MKSGYFFEHGLFSKVLDIKKVMVITEEIYKKIEPFLSLLVAVIDR
jgi:hypothetical protein